MNWEVVEAMAEALSAVRRLQVVVDLGRAPGCGQCCEGRRVMGGGGLAAMATGCGWRLGEND